MELIFGHTHTHGWMDKRTDGWTDRHGSQNSYLDERTKTLPQNVLAFHGTLVKDWTFGPRQVLDFGAEKYTLKCYELYEAKIESFQA